MERFSLSTLEYESIKRELLGYAVSYAGRKRIEELAPMVEKRAIERAIAETAEAVALYRKGASVPLPSLEGIEQVVSLLGTGYLFTEQDLTAVQTFLHSCGQLKKYMAAKGELAWRIGIYATDLQDLPALQQEILRCIRHGVIMDDASRELEKIRKKISIVKERIQKRIQAVMARHASILQENIVSVRGGRYVIPVKKDYYKQVNGRMLDQSTSGQTAFIEPQEVAALQSELELLQGEEAREEAKILGYLAGLVEREAADLIRNIEITGLYDFIFAKAKYAAAIGGTEVQLSETGETVIRGAKHPKLLQTMVPLDMAIGTDYRTLIITGPNTGGKTVVLKTFGLLTLMVQSGLLVPVSPDSRFAVYQGIRAVIGDGQNLEQSLSTFSAQIGALVQILKESGPATLVLIDELAAGTDPGEGIALSIAILEEFARKGSTVMVTTHFNELKTFASRAEGFENARMEFDAETLRPLYRLTIGQSGRSYAIEIARKLGMSGGIIERSQHIVSRQQSTDGSGSGGLRWDEIVPAKPSAAARDARDKAASVPGSSRAAGEPGKGKGAKGQLKPQRAAGLNGGGTETVTGAGKPADAEAATGEAALPPSRKFEVGDAVLVTSIGKIGIVVEPPDLRGMALVQVQKQKIKVNHKRLKPYLKSERVSVSGGLRFGYRVRLEGKPEKAQADEQTARGRLDDYQETGGGLTLRGS
ncbi:DNA mismatch repair protein MutS [Paenibacillus phoenicis]|uniref:DNA mismatch repair protein MutS n=1 Tax=Paenibacillus phoenicis TaxID=554117 RepID=A0ABU5PR17_9BACL|nr:DNA mismatch repair protein MutS [Paenibacillus phoenicis]MEA3572398.1 DNA mismatch repair protein MutS [Paenibacillus phoenicis]